MNAPNPPIVPAKNPARHNPYAISGSQTDANTSAATRTAENYYLGEAGIFVY
jgi:hypothetical protein